MACKMRKAHLLADPHFCKYYRKNIEWLEPDMFDHTEAETYNARWLQLGRC